MTSGSRPLARVLIWVAAVPRSDRLTWNKLIKRSCTTWAFLTGMKVKSEREVPQSCPTLCDPTDCSPPGSSILGTFQAKVLEWVVISFSRGSSRPRDRTRVSHTPAACSFPGENSSYDGDLSLPLGLALGADKGRSNQNYGFSSSPVWM